MDNQGTGLGDLILGADEETWTKIKNALGVKSREQAAKLAEENDDVATVVEKIIASGEEAGSAPGAEENPAASSPDNSSAPLTRSPAEAQAGAAETLYPNQGKGGTQKRRLRRGQVRF